MKQSDPARQRRGPSEAVLHAVLTRASIGEMTVNAPSGSSTTYAGSEQGPKAQVNLRSARAARDALLHGSIGFADGYINGEWDTPDLAGLLEYALTNIRATTGRPIPAPARPLQRIYHRLRSNSRRGSRRNISYHYDLGNEFYRLWLDDDLTYSCALFENTDSEDDDRVSSAASNTPSQSLSAAQRAKWDRLLELLQPSRRDHLLEIGCGWGGFAAYAAAQAGCRVTGITLSQEQHSLAAERIAEEGLDGLVDIRVQDYRSLSGTFDGIASIEMFEAVGEKYWPLFFGRVNDLLSAGGRAAMQTITIADEHFERYRRKPDFIQRYIFPGGMLPSPERFTLAAARAGLSVSEPHLFGLSYARTLELWQDRFESARDDILALGFDERFLRMWRFYLAYCRTGFISGHTNVMQVALEPARR